MTTFQTHTPAPAPQPGGNKTWLYVGIGCLGVLLLGAIACAVGGYFVFKNAKSLAADGMRAVTVQAINESHLPDADKQTIVVHVDRLTADFKGGKITFEDLSRVFEKLSQGPVMQIGALLYVEKALLEPSSLTDAEKQDGSLQLQRVIRGLHEEKISPWEADSLLSLVQEVDANGATQIKSNPTPQELKDLIADARQRADAADVPSEPYTVNLGDEVGRVVEEALNNATGGTQP